MRRLITAALTLTLISPAAFCQMAARDFSYITGTNAWLTSSNPARLGTLPVDRISVAAISLEKINGELRDVHESPSSMEVQAGTESFVRISPKLSFHGRMGYSYFSGQNMNGPILMDPYRNFINLDERDEGNAGTKTRELFTLDGSLSYKFSDRWSIGAKGYFQSGSYAKRKDPRHLNSWMELQFRAGTAFEASEKVSLGLNLEYNRSFEGITANIFGSQDQNFFYLVDYGLFYGNIVVLSNTGSYINTSASTPVLNQSYGGSLQAEIKAGSASIYNEAGFLMRKGDYGKKGTSEILYATAKGFEVYYKGSANFGGKHIVRLQGSYTPTTADKTNFRQSTTAGQTSEIQYFGSQQCLSRKQAEGRIAYTGYFGVRDQMPATTVNAGINAWYRNTKAELYPFYRKQNLLVLSANAEASHNFFVRDRNILTPGAGISFSKGFGKMKEDGQSASAQGGADTLDGQLQRSYEFLSITKLAAGLSFRYTRVINPRFSVHAEVSDSFTAALSQPEFLAGKTNNRLLFTIGCTF